MSPIAFGPGSSKSFGLASRQNIRNLVIQDTSLRVWYDFQNPSCYPGSGTTVTNLAPYSHTGTLQNSTSYAAGSMIFNGIDGVISIADSSPTGLSNPTSCTVEVWTNLGSFTSIDGDTTQFIVNMGAANATDLCQVAGAGGSNPTFRMRTYIGGGNYKIASASGISTGQWYHIVGTYEPNSFTKIYVNGVETIGNATDATTAQFNSSSYQLGLYFPGANSFALGGLITQHRLYRRALTKDEVLHNFNATRWRYGV